TCRSFNRRKLVINLKTAKALGLDVPTSCSLDQMRQAQAATIGLNQGAVPGKTGLKANPVLDPRPTLASQGIDKVARAPGPPARPVIGRGFRAKDRGGTGLGRPCFSRRRPRDRSALARLWRSVNRRMPCRAHQEAAFLDRQRVYGPPP